MDLRDMTPPWAAPILGGARRIEQTVFEIPRRDVGSDKRPVGSLRISRFDWLTTRWLKPYLG